VRWCWWKKKKRKLHNSFFPRTRHITAIKLKNPIKNVAQLDFQEKTNWKSVWHKSECSYPQYYNPYLLHLSRFTWRADTTRDATAWHMGRFHLAVPPVDKQKLTCRDQHAETNMQRSTSRNARIHSKGRGLYTLAHRKFFWRIPQPFGNRRRIYITNPHLVYGLYHLNPDTHKQTHSIGTTTITTTNRPRITSKTPCWCPASALYTHTHTHVMWCWWICLVGSRLGQLFM